MLLTCAAKEPESVRRLFTDLYKEDNDLCSEWVEEGTNVVS